MVAMLGSQEILEIHTSSAESIIFPHPACHTLRTPNGIRTRAAALKGQYPRPLDDGGV